MYSLNVIRVVDQIEEYWVEQEKMLSSGIIKNLRRSLALPELLGVVHCTSHVPRNFFFYIIIVSCNSTIGT